MMDINSGNDISAARRRITNPIVLFGLGGRPNAALRIPLPFLCIWASYHSFNRRRLRIAFETYIYIYMSNPRAQKNEIAGRANSNQINIDLNYGVEISDTLLLADQWHITTGLHDAQFARKNLLDCWCRILIDFQLLWISFLRFFRVMHKRKLRTIQYMMRVFVGRLCFIIWNVRIDVIEWRMRWQIGIGNESIDMLYWIKIQWMIWTLRWLNSKPNQFNCIVL